jgi:hypothetical protein
VGREPREVIVGDYRQGVTPVPIPNTAVKPLPPMILLSGKVGYRRLDEPGRVYPGQVLFFALISPLVYFSGYSEVHSPSLLNSMTGHHHRF